MEKMQENNISTYATWIAIAITGILSYFGIQYDYNALIPVIAGIITLIIAIWSSKNPNNIKWLGNETRPPYDINEQILNDEYETTEEDDGC